MEDQLRRRARLSSITITGSTHLIHGELWLFYEGILRSPIGCLMSDGRKIQLLVPARDTAYLQLHAAFLESLGEAFISLPQQSEDVPC